MGDAYCCIGRRECGCICAAVVDMARFPKETAQAVAEFISDGLTVERVTVDYVRNNFSKDCDKCRKPTQMTLGGAQ